MVRVGIGIAGRVMGLITTITTPVVVVFIPSLNFTDSRNSMYVGAGLV